MSSSLIDKVEKAKIYAKEPQRVTFSSLSADFHGEHDLYKLSYRNGKWQCSCKFFSQWGICSHAMALQQMLAKTLPLEALVPPPIESPQP